MKRMAQTIAIKTTFKRQIYNNRLARKSNDTVMQIASKWNAGVLAQVYPLVDTLKNFLDNFIPDSKLARLQSDLGDQYTKQLAGLSVEDVKGVESETHEVAVALANFVSNMRAALPYLNKASQINWNI